MAKASSARIKKTRKQKTPVRLGPPLIAKIISGGQTGVDRAALDAAIAAGIHHGGWCPRGRLAEDGKIPRKYQLQETDSRSYWVRTQKNVQESDGTLILYRRAMTSGTALTKRFACELRKPLFYIDLAMCNQNNSHADLKMRDLLLWLRLRQIQVLNVAGPRRSTAPGIQTAAKEFLLELLRHCESLSQAAQAVNEH